MIIKIKISLDIHKYLKRWDKGWKDYKKKITLLIKLIKILKRLDFITNIWKCRKINSEIIFYNILITFNFTNNWHLYFNTKSLLLTRNIFLLRFL